MLTVVPLTGARTLHTQDRTVVCMAQYGWHGTVSSGIAYSAWQYALIIRVSRSHTTHAALQRSGEGSRNDPPHRYRSVIVLPSPSLLPLLLPFFVFPSSVSLFRVFMRRRSFHSVKHPGNSTLPVTALSWLGYGVEIFLRMLSHEELSYKAGTALRGRVRGLGVLGCS